MQTAWQICGTCCFFFPCHGLAAQDWPALPITDGAVEIPAPEWTQRPGPRTVRIQVHFPGGGIQHIDNDTGIMLTLHNWGGTDCVGRLFCTGGSGSGNVKLMCNKLVVQSVTGHNCDSGMGAAYLSSSVPDTCSRLSCLLSYLSHKLLHGCRNSILNITGPAERRASVFVKV